MMIRIISNNNGSNKNSHNNDDNNNDNNGSNKNSNNDNNDDNNHDDIIYVYIYGLDYSDHYGYSRLTEQNSPCSLSKSNGDAARF